MSYNSKYKGSEVEELLDSIGNKVDKVDGKQLSTEDFTTLLKQKLDDLSNYDDTAIQESVSKLRTDLDTLVSGDTTTAIKTFNEVIAFLEGISDTEDLASIIASIEQQIAGKMDKVTLAAVATSGSYNDLSNKPTIPTAVTESTVSGWGFTKNTGTYSKPSGGIPKSDLASAVQTSLGKADTALQSYTEQYKGTVTGVKMNGTTKNPSNGVVDLGTVITAHQDISGKQDKLVSGTNIKTINGESILGSGNIVIEGGSGEGGDYLPLTGGVLTGPLTIKSGGISVASTIITNVGFVHNGVLLKFSQEGISLIDADEENTILATVTSGDGTKFLANDGTYKTIETSGGTSSGGSGAYALVEHGTSDTTFTLTPNTFHVWNEVATLDLSFGTETSGVANEYLFQFTSGATATTLTLPSDIKWANDTAPTIAENMIYQISVLKGLASVLEFSNEVSVFPATLVNGVNGDLGVSVYRELNEIAQGGSGTLASGDLTFVVNSENISVTSFFYTASPYPGYVIYDTGMEYYILQINGTVLYYFYD